MLRDAVGYTCEVKTAQETGEGKIGEFREIGGKLVNCVSPMVKQNSQTVKLISPTSEKKGGK